MPIGKSFEAFCMTMPLPDYTEWVKTLTRALVEQCAAPGQTGQERAAALLARDRATISRYCSSTPENAGKIMPLPMLMQLEHITQRPILADALASITYHSLSDEVQTPSVASDKRLLSGFVNGIAVLGHLSQEWAEAAADGRFTPAERRHLAEELTATARVLTAEVASLTVTEGEA
jgi:hypothetical protein